MKKTTKVWAASACMLLGLAACQDKKSAGLETITVKVEEVQTGVELDKLADVSLVVLPTSDSLLLGSIRDVQCTDKYIYLSDGTSIYRFSYKGEPLGKISKRGQGPEDYRSVSDFQVDDEGNIWVPADNTLKLYDWDGKMKRKIQLDRSFLQLHLHGNKMFLYAGNMLTETCHTQLHVLDMETEKMEATFKEIDKNQANYLHFFGTDNFQTTADGELLFGQIHNDTVYTLTDRSYTPRHVFDWDGRNVPKSFYDRSFRDIMEFNQEFDKVSYAYGSGRIIESDEAVWVNYYYNKKNTTAVIPKNKGKEQTVFTSFRINELAGEYPFSPVFILNGGKLAIPIQIDKLMEQTDADGTSAFDKLKEKYPELPEDSNPLLLIVSPK